MVVGSPGIVADTSYDVFFYGAYQKNLRKIHNFCKKGRFRCQSYVSQKVDTA